MTQLLSTCNRDLIMVTHQYEELDKKYGKYSLQSGAFGFQENAEKQKRYIISGGFNARTVELYQQTN